MTAARSPSAVLGVAEGAPAADVRRAYRRQALRYHPDRNPNDPAAQEAFLDVQRAYRALTETAAEDGLDAEQVVAQMQRAAQEAERRRSRPGEGGRGWQQARVALDRSRRQHAVAVLRTPRARGVLALALAVGGGVGVGLMPLWALAGVPVALPAWAPLAVGLALAAGVLRRVAAEAELAPWAVETHWQGLRDLRWDVVVEWAEIRGVRQADGGVELALTARAAHRLGQRVPPGTFGAGGVYRLPLRDGGRLVALVQAHRAG